MVPVRAAQPHPSLEELSRFMRAELTATELRGVVRHLLSGCEACSRALAPFWEIGMEPISGPDLAASEGEAEPLYRQAFLNAMVHLTKPEAQVRMPRKR